MKIVGATGLVISVTIFYLATLWALEWAWTGVANFFFGSIVQLKLFI